MQLPSKYSRVDPFNGVRKCSAITLRRSNPEGLNDRRNLRDDDESFDRKGDNGTGDTVPSYSADAVGRINKANLHRRRSLEEGNDIERGDDGTSTGKRIRGRTVTPQTEVLKPTGAMEDGCATK